MPRLEWTVGSLATLGNPPKILLGGPALGDTPDLAISMGADAIAQSLTDAVLEGRRLIGIAKEPVSLNDQLVYLEAAAVKYSNKKPSLMYSKNRNERGKVRNKRGNLWHQNVVFF